MERQSIGSKVDLKIIVWILLALAILLAILGLLTVDERIEIIDYHLGFPVIVVACLIGIIALILQSQIQHWELLDTLNK